MMAATRWISLCVIATALFGCAARPASNTSRAPALPPALELFESTPASGAIRAQDLLANLDSPRRYAILDESGHITGETVRIQTATEKYAAKIAETEHGREMEYRRVDEQGNLMMTAQVDLGENALTHFTPAMIIAPRELNPGEKHASSAAIRVVDRRNPLNKKESGQATRTVEYVGDQRLRTPLGEFIAKRIEIHFSADMKMADADERTTLYLVPDVGIVAEQSERTVKILGAFNRTDRRMIVLVK